MKMFFLLLFILGSMPILAQPAFAQEEEKPAETEGVSLNGVWRSDAALYDAEDLIRQKKYSVALTVLDQIIARNIRNADAHVDSAIAWMNLGNKERAKASLTNALAIDKGHMGAYVMLGVVALMEKNPSQAGYYLGALRVVCRGDTCPEYQRLQKIIRETKTE